MGYSVPLMEAHQSKYSVKEFLKLFISCLMLKFGSKTEENLNKCKKQPSGRLKCLRIAKGLSATYCM